MNALALVLASLAAALHVLIFVLESVLWTRQSVWRRFAVRDAQQAEELRGMAYNQGFYNLFLALGAGIGVLYVITDRTVSGWTLVVFCCASMVVAALVLLSTGRRYARAAATQATFPLLALVVALAARLG